jgi:hypothetical protein
LYLICEALTQFHQWTSLLLGILIRIRRNTGETEELVFRTLLEATMLGIVLLNSSIGVEAHTRTLTIISRLVHSVGSFIHCLQDLEKERSIANSFETY